MEVENNNNTIVPVNKNEHFAYKRSATVDDEDNAEKIKRLKRNELEPCSDAQGVDAHVTEGTNKKLAAHRPPAHSPKKRIQLDNKNAAGLDKKPKYNKHETFMFGNYRHYYGKRILDKDFHDIRLDVLATQSELFRDKQLLDIGCNSGHLSLEIAKKFEVKSLVGLDIDRFLTHEAQMAVNLLKRASNVSAANAAGRFPYNVKFVHGNYVLADDVLLEIERPQYDIILCLSVTKWIHLNFCDEGLKQAFRRMYLQLHPGGKLILEPQSFDTYKRRKKLTDNIRENYNAIRFKPEQFTAYLLSPEVGFADMELMGVPEHCQAGFKRPIQIFNKV
ncbi:probable RNA methyltransferase CG1239 [Drosophila montana]|uniref:probable RNA methyltransferase CG1239 n=1 Tax=Drosophila montana TaxID=40370 RepID=UPI00313F34E7